METGTLCVLTLLILTIHQGKSYYYPHFIDKRTEASGDKGACLLTQHGIGVMSTPSWVWLMSIIPSDLTCAPIMPWPLRSGGRWRTVFPLQPTSNYYWPLRIKAETVDSELEGPLRIICPWESFSLQQIWIVPTQLHGETIGFGVSQARLHVLPLPFTNREYWTTLSIMNSNEFRPCVRRWLNNSECATSCSPHHKLRSVVTLQPGILKLEEGTYRGRVSVVVKSTGCGIKHSWLRSCFPLCDPGPVT